VNSRFVVVVGDSEGLGNAVLYWLLNTPSEAIVIGISRRGRQDVERIDVLDEKQKKRFVHLQYDLQESLEPLVEKIEACIKDGNGILLSLIMVTGTGFLDSEVTMNPDLKNTMIRLNYGAQVELMDELKRRSLLLSTTQIFYFSALVTHPSITDPLLQIHAGIKSEAVTILSDHCGRQLTVVLPGAYKTDMLMRIIQRKDSLLEWFGLPLADPYERGGLAHLISQKSLSGSAPKNSEIIRPLGCKVLVTTFSANSLQKLLPSAIRRTARSVLKQIGQNDQDHDERVRYAKELNVYGEQFEYDSILSNRLWSEKKSLRYARCLQLAGLMK